MPERRAPAALDRRTAFRLLEIRAGKYAIRALNTRARTGARELPSEEELSRAVLEAADQVRAGTWVDPDPPRRLTDDQVQDWIDKARVRANAIRMGKDVQAWHDLHNLIVDASIMIAKSMARRRAAEVEKDIIADMRTRGVEPQPSGGNNCLASKGSDSKPFA